MKQFSALIFFFLFLRLFAFANETKNDSLYNLLKKTKNTETKVEVSGELAQRLFYNYPDSALALVESALKIAKSKGNHKTTAKAYIHFATILSYRGNVSEGLRYYGKALQLIRSYKLGNKLEYEVNLQMGHNHFMVGSGVKAKIYYLQLLKHYSNDFELFEAYRNLGAIYSAIDKYDSSFYYYRKCLMLSPESIDKKSKGYIHNNMMRDFMALQMYDSALVHQEKMNLYFTKKDLYDYANILLSKGEILLFQKKYKEVLPLFDELNTEFKGKFLRNDYNILSLELKYYVALKNKTEVNRIINDLKDVHSKDKDENFFIHEYILAAGIMKDLLPDKALLMLNEALEVSSKNNYWDELIIASGYLKEIYKSSGDCDKMEHFMNLQKSYYDTLHALEGRSQISNMEYKNAIDIRLMQDSIYRANKDRIEKSEREKSEAKQQEKIRTQQYLLYASGFILSFVILFLYVVFRNLKRKKRDHELIVKQKKEITLQKELVDEKQKEIIDSINYAQRLQRAVLAPVSEIQASFADEFLLYLPKDIVAGDFYFFERSATHIFYAAADCTGHGVPGALVSIVCSNSLSRAVNEFALTDPGEICNKTRELILSTFKKSGQEIKDGMDISILSMKYVLAENNKPQITEVSWAGANNPLWFIAGKEWVELDPDKQPIGKSDEYRSFTTHVLPSNVSIIYLFTDGFADQFGGPKGKKFKYSNFKKLLWENHHLPLSEQKMQLYNSFINWKGDLEQVDDICVIGIKID